MALAACNWYRGKQMNAQAKTIPSPCTGICRTDDTSGLCLGCGRTRDEIAEWPSADDARRALIWLSLPDRFNALDIAITRLPWFDTDITEFVVQSLRKRSGTWVLGCYGATAEFVLDEDEPCDISVTGNTITAISSRAALRLTLEEQVRALQLRDKRSASGHRAIFLVVLKSRANMSVPEGLQALGPDEQAIRSAARDQMLFDLGLGRPELRFCVRTAIPDLLSKLHGATGTPLSSLLPVAGADLLRHSPTRVVETPLGRAEIDTIIPPPDGKSPDGPHTHLLPDHLATGRATQPGNDLPPVYALGATFYPRALRDEGCS